MFLLLVLVLLAVQTYAAILPSSVYTQNILFGPSQKQSTQQVMTFACSETNSQGRLIVGNYNLSITCNPAVAEFTYTSIAAIPQEVLFQTNLQLLVTNVTAANQALTYLLGNFQGSLRRRLLSINSDSQNRKPKDAEGEIGMGLALVSLVWDAALQGQVGILFKDVGELQEDINSLTDLTTQLGGQLHDVEGTVTHLTDVVATEYNVTQNALAAQELQLQVQNGTLQIIQNFAAATQNNLVSLQTATAAALGQLQSSTNSEINNTNHQVANLANVLLNLTATFAEQLNQLKINEDIAQQALNSRDNNIENQISNRGLLAALTQLVFSKIQALPQAFSGFFTDAGIAPGVLVGQDLINLQETITVNYVTQPNHYHGNYQIHNTQISFYLDTMFGIQQLVEGAQIVLPFDILPRYFTGPICSRAYPGSTNENSDPPSTKPCRMFVEISDFYCTSNRWPQFNWTTANSIEIPNSTYWCNVGAIQPVDPATNTNFNVYKDFPSLQSWVATSLCPARTNGTLLMAYQRSGIVGTINPPADTYNCNLAWDAMKDAMNNLGTTNLFIGIFNGVYQSWSIANQDLTRKQFKRFGTLPGGVDVALLPYLHFPVGTNSTTGVPIYDATAIPKVAMRGTWAAVHQNTVQVHSMVPSNNPAVYTSITVDIEPVAGYSCTDSTCYNVGSTDITQNIVYESNILPPQQPTVFLGSLVPEILTSQGMFDVPQSELACNQNNRLNENTLCYLRFPPGTTQTGTLPEWAFFNNVVYDPLKASASATDFRFPVIFDAQGFPMCSNAIAPGSITNLTVDVHLCNSPYTFKNATAPNLLSSTPVANLPAECLQPGTVTLFNAFLDSLWQHTTVGSSASTLVYNPLSEFSFWFQSSLVVQDPGAGLELVVLEVTATNYLRFLIDTNGNPALVLSTSATADTTFFVFDTRSSLTTANLRDGVLHQIVWTIASSGSGNAVFKLWIDEIYQGSFSTSSYITTAATYSQSTFTITQDFSNADFITLGLMNPAASNIRMPNSYGCQQAWFDSRCTQPSGLENLLIVRENVTNNNNVFCDTSAQLVSTNLAFDSLFPQALVGASSLFTTTAWSLSFWVRLPVAPVAGQYLMLQNQLTTVQVSLSALLLKIYVNGVLVASLNVYSQQLSYMVALSYNGATLTTYLNGVIQSGVSVTASTGAAGTLVNNTSNNYLSMIKFYPNEALTSTQANNEMLCMVEQPVLPGFFVPPIGFCEQSQADLGHGYCRSPLLCAGHCSAYSTIDTATRTFVPGALNCDPGYQVPDCTKQCTRTDPATGVCIDLTNLFAAGPVPLGSICQDALHYQIEMNTATSRVTETARRWLYWATINIPSGAVTSIVGAGACPKTTLTPFGNTGALLASFLNTDTQETNIRVFYAPTTVYTDNAECTPSCCNANTIGQLFSIQPGLTASLEVPQCGNVTITIARLDSVNTYVTCSTIEGDSLLQALYSGTNLQSATTIASINAIVQPVANNLFDYFQAVQLANINSQILNAGFRNATNGELDILFNIRDTVLAQTFTTFNSTGFAPLANLTSLVDAEVAGLQAQLAAAALKLAVAQGLEAQIPAMLSAVYAQLNNESSATAATLKGLFALQQQESLQGAFDINFNPLNEIGNVITGAAKAVVKAGETAVDTALGAAGLLGGGIGGFFGALINILIYVAIIAAVVYAAYWIYTHRESFVSKKNKHNEEGSTHETTPLTKEPQAAHAAFRVNRQV